jgi:hypothetical protein
MGEYRPSCATAGFVFAPKVLLSGWLHAHRERSTRRGRQRSSRPGLELADARLRRWPVGRAVGVFRQCLGEVAERGAQRAVTLVAFLRFGPPERVASKPSAAYGGNSTSCVDYTTGGR